MLRIIKKRINFVKKLNNSLRIICGGENLSKTFDGLTKVAKLFVLDDKAKKKQTDSVV